MPTDSWEASALRALRAERGLTQQQLAKEAGIDRSVLIALEKGRRQMSRYYAERLAAPLKTKPGRLLPPPPPKPQRIKDPLARLATLEAEVAQIQEERATLLQEVVARLAALEANQAAATHPEAQPSTARKPPR